METLRQDVRYGLRMLWSRPALTLTAIVSLGLGIGANTAIFSVVNALLLKSLPYADADHLVLVWGVETDSRSNDRSQVSATDVADYRAQNTVFQDITTYGGWSGTLTGQGGVGGPERVNGEQVGDGYFQIMGGTPLLGRVFAPDDQIDGKDFVLVLSFGLWQRQFAGDPGVVGRSVSINARPYTVVGVMPPGFAPLPASLVDRHAEFYRPVGENYDDQQRSSRHLRAIARLKPGVTLARAQAEMRAIAARLEAAHPADDSHYTARVITLAEDTVGGLRLSLLMLLGAVAFVLLIACANVANMLLMRAMGRQQEIAIRAALGAGRLRMVRQFLTESVLLALAGGTIGLLAAWQAGSIIEALGSQSFPMLAGIRMDGRVLGFTLALSVLTGLVFGFAPALGASHLDLTAALKEGGRGSGRGSSSKMLRSALVVGEVAVAVVLLAAAGLLIKSVSRLRDVDGGFNPKNLLTMDLSLPLARYPQSQAQAAFFKQLVERIEVLPGVESAGFVSILPLGKDFDGRALALEDQPKPRGQEIGADMYVVTPGYLTAMGIRLVKGRMLSATDDDRSPPSALINERFARDVWPNQDPLGKRISFPGMPGSPPEWRTIVGVVGNVDQYGPDKEPVKQFYLPEAQYPFQYGSLVIRTRAEPSSLASAAQGQVHGMDKDLAVYDVATMEELLSDSISLRRFSMVLLGLFAFIALTLAAVGTYSVISYSVTQQAREIGIRMALGASGRDVLRFVLAQGMRPAFVGVVFGVAGALVLTRFMSSMLFSVSPSDPGTFAAIIAVLATVALLACCIPAVRASRTDPMIALRYE
jgi:predicted permease